ncbi:hypothetical protein L0128_09630 [candidate division KSB1 bacterium]|nr:hypothetical protein [candidate division KSB1 bacterium]
MRVPNGFWWLKLGLGFSLSCAGSLMPAEKSTILPDLDVTFISRHPRYERYRVAYQARPDGHIGDINPYLTSAEQSKKRWPDPGERVTFIAHVKNHGLVPVTYFDYRWFLDGQEVARGTAGALNPAAECTFVYHWRWQSGPHMISFEVDPQAIIPEITTRNNQITQPTNALSFHFHVEQAVYDFFRSIKNSWGSYSWDDWVQSQVALMNALFKQAVYPLTPQGITERVYLDSISIHPDHTLDPTGTHAPEDWEWDGRWGFTVGYLETQFYQKNPWALKNEWSLIHELGHQLGRIDLYCLDLQARENQVNGMAYRSKSYWGLMHSGIYLPADEVHFFCEHTAASLNRDLGMRRGHFGEYLLDLPARNELRVVNAQDQPWPQILVQVYQPDPMGYTEKQLTAAPKFSGQTDAHGLFSLGPQPFGAINNWGTNGILLIELTINQQKHYRWLEIVDFNLEYWRGHTQHAVYTLVIQ